MTKRDRVFLVVVGTVCVVGVLVMAFEGKKETPQAEREISPIRTDADRMADSVSAAPYAASQVLSARFKAPSQVEYSDRKLLLRKDNFALVSVVVDAPNSFGVKLRSRWCYILKYELPAGNRFTWDRNFGVWQCQERIGPADLLGRQAAAGWPGAEEALLAETQKAEAPKRRTVR